MAKPEIVLIGGSAGSLESVNQIVGELNPSLRAAVVVIIHLRAREPSYLASILQRAGRLDTDAIKEGQKIEHGTVYAAVPDRHVLIANRHFHLSRGPREGLHRPSINVAFRSAAAVYGDRVIGVLLSGMLDDGAAGLWEITRRHGVAIVQDPDEAAFPNMPLAALQDVPIQYTARAGSIGPLINDLVAGREVPRMKRNGSHRNNDAKEFSGLTCPECHGPLYSKHALPVEFRCRVGHAFSLHQLLDESTSVQERKLYEAMVALEEGADLAELTAGKGAKASRRGLLAEAKQLRQHADTVRKLIEERKITATG